MSEEQKAQASNDDWEMMESQWTPRDVVALLAASELMCGIQAGRYTKPEFNVQVAIGYVVETVRGTSPGAAPAVEQFMDSMRQFCQARSLELPAELVNGEPVDFTTVDERGETYGHWEWVGVTVPGRPGFMRGKVIWAPGELGSVAHGYPAAGAVIEGIIRYEPPMAMHF